MTAIELRNKAVAALTNASWNLVHSELSDQQILEYLLFIFSVFMNMGSNFDASSVAEDVSFDLFKYSQAHDKAFSKWRNKTLKGFVGMGDLLAHVIDQEEPAPMTEPQKEIPNILDLSSQTTKEDECIDLAKHLSTVLNHSQLPEKIYSVIHEELGMMDQPSEVFNTPEYIAKVLCNQGGENE